MDEVDSLQMDAAEISNLASSFKIVTSWRKYQLRPGCAEDQYDIKYHDLLLAQFALYTLVNIHSLAQTNQKTLFDIQAERFKPDPAPVDMTPSRIIQSFDNGIHTVRSLEEPVAAYVKKWASEKRREQHIRNLSSATRYLCVNPWIAMETGTTFPNPETFVKQYVTELGDAVVTGTAFDRLRAGFE